MHARMTTIHSPSERMDDGIEQVRRDILPLFRELGGFRGLIGLVNRTANTGITISLWDDEETMQESEGAGQQLRQQAAAAMKAETEPMVNRYEVAYLEVESPATASVTD
jgi:heme-degrading monooxygenase HmoA